MHGKNDRHPQGDDLNQVGQMLQLLRIIHCSGTVQRQEEIAGVPPKLLENRRTTGLFQRPNEFVDHDVSYQVDVADWNSFAGKIIDAGLLGHEEQV
jgi:hypothetical protein